jgi:thymidine kinase
VSLTLIIGPMKSGKSLELLARAEPYKYAGKKVTYIKPERDVRETDIASRVGVKAQALSLVDLVSAPDSDVYAVDEVHMFSPITTPYFVLKWLDADKEVIISGLNTDHAGRLMPTVAKLLELSPEVLINKQAVCDQCGQPATHTQVMEADGQPIPKTMSAEVPDDGTYKYEARCRLCFE